MNYQEEKVAFEKHASKFFTTNEAFENDGKNYVYDEVKFMWDCWLAAKSQAVPDLGDLQERIAGHQYYHDEHGHMIVDMDDVVKEISGFDSWKAKAVPEGFVLVKMDDLELLRDSALTIKYASLNNDSDRIFSDIEDIQLSIERLIEAREQSHE